MGRDTRKFLPDDLKALDAALLGNHARGVLKRLWAVKLVLDGTSVRKAAIAMRCQPATVTMWVNGFELKGCDALLDAPVGRPPLPKWSAEISTLKDEIRAAMQGDRSSPELTRLKAVAAALDGTQVGEIAKQSLRHKETVRGWLRQVRKGGVGALLCDTEARRSRRQQLAKLQDISLLAAASEELRRLAKSERNCLARRRLIALAEVGSGRDKKIAAAGALVKEDTLLKWISDFQDHGMRELRTSAAT